MGFPVMFCCSFVEVVIAVGDGDKKLSTHGDEVGRSDVSVRTSVRRLEAWYAHRVLRAWKSERLKHSLVASILDIQMIRPGVISGAESRGINA